MNQKITLYHGSEQLVETPTFGLGKKNNDFGLGFYCTGSEELAKEWAVSSLRNGFANRYSLDTESDKPEIVSVKDRLHIWIFMGFKAHQYLLPRTLFNSKIYRQFLLAEKRDLCCFDVLSERSSLIPAQDKRLQNTISIIYRIVLSPILNSNESFRCYNQSGFLMNLFSVLDAMD